MGNSEKLVKIEDLYNGDAALISQKNQLNILLNQPPKKDWLKRTDKKVFGKEIDYLPVSTVEFLLTAIFQEWRIEVKEIQVIANSVVVTIRLHYFHPINNEWSFQDGVGAAPIITSKGAAATDFTQVQSSSVMKAVPAAKTFAKKDAADELGKIFGKDLNRNDSSDYDVLQHKFKQESEIDKLKKELSEKIGICQDSEMTGKIITELLEAEENGKNTVEFYTEILKKFE